MRLYTAQQYTEAKAWFEEVAHNNHAEAAFYLGVLYDRGEGVRQDDATARQWYEKAAAAGNEDAKNRLRNLSQ